MSHFVGFCLLSLTLERPHSSCHARAWLSALCGIILSRPSFGSSSSWLFHICIISYRSFNPGVGCRDTTLLMISWQFPAICNNHVLLSVSQRKTILSFPHLTCPQTQHFYICVQSGFHLSFASLHAVCLCVYKCSDYTLVYNDCFMSSNLCMVGLKSRNDLGLHCSLCSIYLFCSVFLQLVLLCHWIRRCSFFCQKYVV